MSNENLLRMISDKNEHIARLEGENERLRNELVRIKPHWKDAPNDCLFRAIDENWQWVYFSNKPTAKSGYGWISGGFKTHVWCPNWQETLEARP